MSTSIVTTTVVNSTTAAGGAATATAALEQARAKEEAVQACYASSECEPEFVYVYDDFTAVFSGVIIGFLVAMLATMIFDLIHGEKKHRENMKRLRGR